LAQRRSVEAASCDRSRRHLNPADSLANGDWVSCRGLSPRAVAVGAPPPIAGRHRHRHRRRGVLVCLRPDTILPPSDFPPRATDARGKRCPDDGAFKGALVAAVSKTNTRNPLLARAASPSKPGSADFSAARLYQARDDLTFVPGPNCFPRWILSGTAALAAKPPRTGRLSAFRCPLSPPCKNILHWCPSVNYEAICSDRVRREVEGARPAAHAEADFENTRSG